MKPTKFVQLVESLAQGGTPSRSVEAFWQGKIPWITGADFENQRVSDIRRHVSEHALRAGTSLVEKGDLLLVTRTGVGKMAIAPFDIAISQDITGIKFIPEQADTLFMFYLLQAKIDYFLALNQGTSINGIVRNDLLNLDLILPEKPEQVAIARVLATLDRAIEQTEALVAKERRIKTGLMQDLLARGIDEHGQLRDPATHRFKDSPLGRVPVEWEVKPLTKIAEINSGVTLGREISGDVTVELPYLRVANVQDGYIDLSDIKTVRIYKQEMPRYLLQSGDVLMNEGGDFDKLGRGTVWRGLISPCLHQNHVFRVRSNIHVLLPDFLAYVSASPYGKKFFVLSSKQSTNLASINSTQLKAFPIPLPSIQEQEKIVAIVHAVDQHIAVEDMYLQKLRRLKTGLMQDLLTGRVSVAPLLQGEL